MKGGYWEEGRRCTVPEVVLVTNWPRARFMLPRKRAAMTTGRILKAAIDDNKEVLRASDDI